MWAELGLRSNAVRQVVTSWSFSGVTISIHSNNTGVKMASKQESMPSYLNTRHSPFMLNATLSSSQKALAAAKFPEAACTQQIRGGGQIALDETDDPAGLHWANGKRGDRLLTTYYVPGTVLSTLHTVFHWILLTNYMRGFPLLSFCYSCGNSGSEDLNSLPTVIYN